MSDVNVMVSVRCAVYNHAPYLRQCLDGFIMQRTTFTFEVIVHDDASTDGSADIIKEYAEKYPQIIKPYYETVNQYSIDEKAMNAQINKRLTGKYVAICEGDDFWTDPKKLQKQVDFLEDHPDYSLCFHAVHYVALGKIVKNNKVYSYNRQISTEEIIKKGGYFCATPSLVFRNKYYQTKEKFQQIADVGDFPLQINLSIKGKVYYFASIMGCYRCQSNNSWSDRERKKGQYNMSHYENSILWLSELDKMTDQKYTSAISFRLVKYLFKPTRNRDFEWKRFDLIYKSINPKKLTVKEFFYYAKVSLYRTIYICINKTIKLCSLSY